jgi:predicted nucleic acid-binding protein
MATYYFDTSATVKRYVTEPGTAEIDEVLDALSRGRPQHTVAFVSVGIVEVVAAFSRLERTGAISALQWNGLATQFNTDLSSRYLALEVTKSVVQEASALTRRRGLRGYDAVHLASALTLRQSLRESDLDAPIFVSADADLCAAARDEGLQVMAPGLPTALP